jgi:CheY-like chemotaxis protein
MNNNKILLYVEDDPGSRKVMRLLVSRLGDSVQIIIFEDSTDFLEKLAALDQIPDIFLLDIHVTPHNGFKMLEMLRTCEHYRGKMIIALTASVMREEINKLKEAGFDGVLGKPLNFSTFPDTVKQIFAGERIWITSR